MIGSSNDDNWFRNDNERADDTRINDDHSRASEGKESESDHIARRETFKRKAIEKLYKQDEHYDQIEK